MRSSRRAAAAGWRYAHELLAELPVLRGRGAASLGKRLYDMVEASPLIKEVLACPAGLTSGPWRIKVPPANILIVDPMALEQLLGDYAAFRSAGKVQDPPVLSVKTLDEIERLTEHGIMTEHDGATLET